MHYEFSKSIFLSSKFKGYRMSVLKIISAPDELQAILHMIILSGWFYLCISMLSGIQMLLLYFLGMDLDLLSCSWKFILVNESFALFGWRILYAIIIVLWTPCNDSREPILSNSAVATSILKVLIEDCPNAFFFT